MRDSLWWIEGWPNEGGDCFREDGSGAGVEQASSSGSELMECCAVLCLLETHNNTYHGLFIHSNAYWAPTTCWDHTAGCLGCSNEWEWSPALLRSFEKHFVLSKALASISSAARYSLVSPTRASLLFPSDGWTRGGREGLSNLLKGKLDRTSIQVSFSPLLTAPPRGVREVVHYTDFSWFTLTIKKL